MNVAYYGMLILRHFALTHLSLLPMLLFSLTECLFHSPWVLFFVILLLGLMSLGNYAAIISLVLECKTGVDQVSSWVVPTVNPWPENKRPLKLSVNKQTKIVYVGWRQ